MILSYYEQRKDPLKKKSATIHKFLKEFEKEMIVTDANERVIDEMEDDAIFNGFLSVNKSNNNNLTGKTNTYKSVPQ